MGSAALMSPWWSTLSRWWTGFSGSRRPTGPAGGATTTTGTGSAATARRTRGGARDGPGPLLTGERGHYELAAGRDPTPYLRALEAFASSTGLLPEQVWDEPDRPEAYMFLGRPTGSAMPLMWAHAEYIKLLRSASDGVVFDLIPEVAARYQGDRRACRPLEVWKPHRQVTAVNRGEMLRIQALQPFRLHWTLDDWQTSQDTASSSTALGIHFGDIAVSPAQRAPVRFSFFWTVLAGWEGRDYMVAVR
jgi:glucoamylase